MTITPGEAALRAARDWAEKYGIAQEFDLDDAAKMLLAFGGEALATQFAEVQPEWAVKRCLDHGFVALIDSMPHWSHRTNGDARIIQAARVSMAHLPPSVAASIGLDWTAEDRSYEQDERLLRYLLHNKHTSPFEKVRFEFCAKVPIFIARQWIRHRTGSFNEVSARYSKLPREYYVPEANRMQAQSSSNKQASGEVLNEVEGHFLRGLIDQASINAYSNYELALSRGLARELSRMVLPLNYYTTWYWTTDLHNLFHFLDLRLHEHAQYEIRVYAQAMLEMIRHVAPRTVSIWEKMRAEDPKKRAVQAEGKLAALIKWCSKLDNDGYEAPFTPSQVLEKIEAMISLDKETTNVA